MQVKKFEAKTIQDALNMIKQELGPEAIILQTKTRKTGFGLVGAGSVEVTAAISEHAAQKRQAAESYLPDDGRVAFRAKSARHQRDFIESVSEKLQQRAATKTAAVTHQKRVQSRNLRYIDIQDDSQPARQQFGGKTVEDAIRENQRDQGAVRVKGLSEKAAKSLAQFLKKQIDDDGEVPKAVKPQQREEPVWNGKVDDVVSLKSEVEKLKKMLEQFSPAKAQVSAAYPGADYGLPFELSFMFEKLIASGVDARYAGEILEVANKEIGPQEKKRKTLVEAWVARYILGHLNVSKGWETSRSKFHFFVGSNGLGKTASLVKLASQLVLQEKKRIAIATTDTLKVGAADQLRIYANILGVPFEVIRGHHDYQTVLHKFRDRDYVLVDVPGLSLRDMNEIDGIKNILPPSGFPRHTHLVMSSTMKDVDAYELATRYQVTRFDDIIVTKLDESFSHGLLYNIQKRTEKPLFAFGIGPKIPEDVELATRERVLDLIFRISKTAKT